ncbi:MAG: cobalamin-dependent protein [Coriobacteriia bacterium]|nr:cobalamin-dependent protein [Coriobacteriia bacterium]
MADDAAAQLYQAFVSQDPAGAIAVVEASRHSGLEQAQLFDQLFAPAMSLLGGAWASGAIDEVTFTQAAVVAEQITSFVTPPAASKDTGVTVLIGSMHRDYHSIGKDVIGAALKEAGHRVVDLGVDVRPAEFLERVEETGSRLLIVAAEMTATARSVVRVREMLTSAGHEDVVMLVTGGPFAADVSLAKQVGANGVVRGVESSLKIVQKIVRDRLGGGT